MYNNIKTINKYLQKSTTFLLKLLDFRPSLNQYFVCIPIIFFADNKKVFRFDIEIFGVGSGWS